MKGIIGAIVGDIVGSLHESFNAGPEKPKKDFSLFTKASEVTDDSICTVAVANWLLKDALSKDVLIDSLHEMCLDGKQGGFGGAFSKWLKEHSREPYNSWGNGSAMRVSPVGWYAQSLPECLDLAKMSAEVTHNHPEGIKGAQATASAIFLTRTGQSKEYIKNYIEKTFGYDLSSHTIEEQTPNYRFYVSCQKSVPQSIQCLLESDTYEETIRKAVCMGGDTDTMAAIAGSIAAATPDMEVPDDMVMAAVNTRWPENGNEMIDIINEFHSKYEV